MKNENLQKVESIPETTNTRTRFSRNPMCWRYMDLLSLLSILQNERIHFSHITELYKYDHQEGTGGLGIDLVNDTITPSVTLSRPNHKVDEENQKEIERIIKELNKPISEQELKEKVKVWDEENNTVYISSWHMNEVDSDFMWRVYGKYEYGLAIETSVQELVGSIVDAGIDVDKLGYGAVIYPTRDTLIRDKIHEVLGNYAAFMIKTPEYSPEKEFRVFVRAIEQVTSCDIKVNLQKLIHKIHISPLVPQWAVKPIIDTLNPICMAKGLPPIEISHKFLREI